MPAAVKVWPGFCAVLVPPSPKFQLQLVIEPVEVSVKPTVRGSVPLVGVALKPAVGAGGGGVLTVIRLVCVSVSEPPGPVTVSETV